MARDMTSRILAKGRDFRNFLRLLDYERFAVYRIPLRTRLWAWRRGYAAATVDRYRVNDENKHLFVSDWARYIRTPRINGRFAPALNNKIVFSRILASYGCDVPEYYCLIRNGRLYQIGSRYRMNTPEDVLSACRAGGRFIVKPYSGGGGVGVNELRAEGDRIIMSGQERSDEEVSAFLTGLEDAAIAERVEQHEYARKVFPHSANSIRIITMWDYEKHEPFVVCAVHRFGTSRSMPADNSGLGGVFCRIDVATGVLEKLHVGRQVGDVEPFDNHPDTGVRTTGLTIPNWGFVKTRLVEICREMAYVPYVGWDVLITERGFTVFEGNSYPHLGYQILEPLLADPRARAFFEHFDIV